VLSASSWRSPRRSRLLRASGVGLDDVQCALPHRGRRKRWRSVLGVSKKDNTWRAAIEAYKAAGAEHASASALVAERLGAGEAPTVAELRREQESHNNVIEARRALFFLFTARTAEES
jgi:hypothetical protein